MREFPLITIDMVVDPVHVNSDNHLLKSASGNLFLLQFVRISCAFSLSGPFF
jgi:hypothetical protein